MLTTHGRARFARCSNGSTCTQKPKYMPPSKSKRSPLRVHFNFYANIATFSLWTIQRSPRAAARARFTGTVQEATHGHLLLFRYGARAQQVTTDGWLTRERLEKHKLCHLHCGPQNKPMRGARKLRWASQERAKMTTILELAAPGQLERPHDFAKSAPPPQSPGARRREANAQDGRVPFARPATSARTRR